MIIQDKSLALLSLLICFLYKVTIQTVWCGEKIHQVITRPTKEIYINICIKAQQSKRSKIHSRTM